MAKKKTKTKIIYRTKKPVEPSFEKKKEELKKEMKELDQGIVEVLDDDEKK